MKKEGALQTLAISVLALLIICLAAWAAPEKRPASEADTPDNVTMFGGTPDRNMASDEKGIPADWDIDSEKNILWSADLGSQTYAGPAVAAGKVYVGTNNEALRNPKLGNDRGVVMTFDSKTGDFLWQIAHPKLPQGRVNDWPLQGICSTPYVEGNRLWYISNRSQIVQADTEGLRNGNEGPFQDEESQQASDGDILWTYNMIDELDVFPHNLTASSPVVVGDLLFTVTSNGVDEDHITLPSPESPSFIAVNKNSGELVWEDASPGENVLHGQWSNPTYAVIKGKPQVIFPGGDGWLYSFVPETGKLIWKFDCNPKDSKWILGAGGTRNNIIASAAVHQDLVYIGVGQDPEHGKGVGHFYALDTSVGEGDITDKATVWQRGGQDFHRTISTAAIQDGLVYVSDLSGNLYCLDAKSGQLYWKYDTFAAIWGSPFVADGKVYLGDEDGDVVILKTGKKMEKLAEPNMGSAVYTTPTAKDGILYIASRNKLFAISEKK